MAYKDKNKEKETKKKYYQKNKEHYIDRKRNLKQGRKNNLKCIDCGQILMENSKSFCEKHWFINASYRALGRRTKDNGGKLKAIWKLQGGRCYYSDEILIKGINASIDHLIPLSRGGKKEIENIVWADYSINSLKGDMTKEEFFSKVKRIYKKHKLS